MLRKREEVFSSLDQLLERLTLPVRFIFVPREYPMLRSMYVREEDDETVFYYTMEAVWRWRSNQAKLRFKRHKFHPHAEPPDNCDGGIIFCLPNSEPYSLLEDCWGRIFRYALAEPAIDRDLLISREVMNHMGSRPKRMLCIDFNNNILMHHHNECTIARLWRQRFLDNCFDREMLFWMLSLALNACNQDVEFITFAGRVRHYIMLNYSRCTRDDQSCPAFSKHY